MNFLVPRFFVSHNTIRQLAMMTLPEILLIKDENVDDTLEQAVSDHDYPLIVDVWDSENIQPLINKNQPDIIIFNIYRPTRLILGNIREINQKHALPIIIFADNNDADTINEVIKSGVSAYVVDGIKTNRINTIIEIAIARFQEQQALKNELKQAKNKLEERKLLDRAKGILIKTRGFSEEEAYHTLRKLAMDRNIPIGEMAKNVISMENLLR